MLKTRIITALPILLLTLAVVFLAPRPLFAVVVALLLLLATWEFARLTDQGKFAAWALLFVQAALFTLLSLVRDTLAANATAVLLAGCIFWLALFVRLFTYRPGTRPDTAYRCLGFLSALGAVTFCWISLLWLHELPAGPLIVFLLLLIIWCSDIGAYFAGRTFGRHALARTISPKKTWEGVYGGILLALTAALLFDEIATPLQIPLLPLAAISVLTTMTSVGGDLFISLHKRTVGLEDSGGLFPGHGGVLDRYDSLLAGAPFFAAAYSFLLR